jgi:Zn-finger nucleic acid-binding protein
LELASKRSSGVEIMSCPECEGCWVQKNRLGFILDKYMKKLARYSNGELRRRKRINPMEVERVKRVCPECGRSMAKLNYAYNSNVIVDQCGTCHGIWLDKGEVEKLAEFFKYCGLPENFRKQLAEIKEIYRKHGSDGGEALYDYDDD